MSSRSGTALVLAIVAFSPSARAEDSYDSLDAPAPPTMPALAHKGVTYTFELTGASISPAAVAPGAAVTRAVAFFTHNDLEIPLAPRKWYLGFSHDSVFGSVPNQGKGAFLGNPELTLRGVWSSVLGLSSGGGLGIVVPTPRDLLREEDNILATLRVVRPWDAAYFQNLTLGIRPWFDVRHIAGRFIIQLRQGIDYSVITRDLKPGEHRQEFVARATFYAGYRLAKPIGVGLEIWEVYQLTADVVDEKRAATSISPSIRFMFPHVEPALSLLLPVSTPLRGDAASYFAARLNVGFTFDTAR